MGSLIQLGNHAQFSNGATFGSLPILNQLSVPALESFSTRITRNYSGNWGRIRRNLNNYNDEIFIGYKNGQPDYQEALNFAGGGSVFVSALYGQVNRTPAIQNVWNNQPRLINNGVLDTLNGKPTLISTNSSTFLEGTLNINGLTGLSLNAVGINTFTGNTGDNRPSFIAWLENGSWGKIYFMNNQTQIGWRFGTGQTNNNRTALATITPNLATFNLIKNGATETPYHNGTTLTPFTGALTTIANNSSTFRLMGSEGIISSAGLCLSEVNIFASALSESDRTLLQNNQKLYFNI